MLCQPKGLILICVSGAACAITGLAWIAIWSHYVQGGAPAGSLVYELRPPLLPRLMSIGGVVVLLGVGIVELVRKLYKRIR